MGDGNFSARRPAQQKPLINDRSNNLQKPIPGSLQEKSIAVDKRVAQVKNIEQSLMKMQLDQRRLQAEFDKIPDGAKTIA